MRPDDAERSSKLLIEKLRALRLQAPIGKQPETEQGAAGPVPTADTICDKFAILLA